MSLAPTRIVSVGLLSLLATLAIHGAAQALSRRPTDAPRLELERLSVPPLPLEYLTQEKAGIRLSYQPSTGERVRPLEERVAAIRAELSAELGREVLGTLEIRVAAAPSEMARLAPMERLEGQAGVFAFRDAHLVVLSAASPRSIDPPNLEGLLRHALAHLALDEALGDKSVPPWLHEGYAVHFAGEDTASRAQTLCFASLQRRLLGLGEIEASFPEGAPQGSIASAEAADFARFLVEQKSEPKSRERFVALLGAIRAGASFDAALRDAYGESAAKVELLWRKDMARRYSFIPVLAGATLVWLLGALAILLRRAGKRRAMVAAREDRRAGAERRASSRAAPRPEREVRRRPERLDDEGLDEAIGPEPEPEVPKIEHDGSWHTLH